MKPPKLNNEELDNRSPIMCPPAKHEIRHVEAGAKKYTDRKKYDHVWYWRAKLPDRKGTSCRVLVRAPAMNSILVEFEADGYTVVTSRYAVRKKEETTMKKHPHFLRWAKHQGGECCICRWIDGQPGVEATDLHHYGASGMGMKGTDYDVCRVCRRHHGIIQGKSWKSLERAGRLDIWAAIVQDGDTLKRKYLGEIDTLHASQEKLF